MTRTPWASCWRSRVAHSYGVAGSRVVPTMTIGGEPGAAIFSLLPVAGTGHTVHGTLPQARYRPQVGASWLSFCANASVCARSEVSALSRQLTA